MPPRSAIIYTDGACSGNPGPAGAGYIILDEDGTTVSEGVVPIGKATNNIAEYQGAISALQDALRLGFTAATLRSDSELMCKQVWGKYRIKNPNLQKLHIELRQQMAQFERVVFEHVMRDKNERADALAREAVKLAKERRAPSP